MRLHRPFKIRCAADSYHVAFQEYAIVHDFSTIRVVENNENVPWSVYVGVLGMPGECLPSKRRKRRLPRRFQVKQRIMAGPNLRSPKRYVFVVILRVHN